MMAILYDIAHQTNESRNRNRRNHLIHFKLGYLLLVAVASLVISYGWESTAVAASGLKIYDYSTKKETIYTNKQLLVTYNNNRIGDTDTPGILEEGIALLPYSDIFSHSGIAADCVYDKDKGTLSISKYDKTIKMTIGSKNATVNGKAVTLSVAPKKIKYLDVGKVKVLVPSRFVSEALGLGYTWISDKNTVAIEKNSIRLSYDDGGVFEYTGAQGKVSIDGKNISLGNMPSIITNNTAMLRAKRVFADSPIGAKYSYNKTSKTVTLVRGDRKLVMTIGSKTAYLNGKAINLDTAPMIVLNHETGSSYVMVPGLTTTSSLGCDYQWNNTTRTSMITIKDIQNTGNDTNNGQSGNTNTGNTSNTGNNNTGNTSNTGNNNTNSNTGNTGNSNTGSSNTGTGNTGSGNASSGGTPTPELGDSGVIYDSGTVLNQWNTNGEFYEKSSGIYELNSGVVSSTNTGYIYYAIRDYTNAKPNKETFVIAASSPFQKVTSSKSGKSVTILAEGMDCTDTTFQMYGISSNFVNTIGTYQNLQGIGSSIVLELLSEEYRYDISLSADQMQLYVNVYANTISAITVGTNNVGDYLTLEGINPIKAVVTKQTNMVFVEMADTVSSLGDIFSEVLASKYISQIYITGNTGKMQIFLTVKEGFEHYIMEDGNRFTVAFLNQGEVGQSQNPVTPETPSTSQPETPDNQGSQNGSGNMPAPTSSKITSVKDKTSYEIVIPLPSGIDTTMIYDEDYYLNKYFVIRISGDHTGFYKSSPVTYKSELIQSVSVALNNRGETEIKIATSKLQGYELAADQMNLYVNIGNPRDIYKNIVVMDPGHGGSANGAQYFDTREKDINFYILYTLGKNIFNQDPSKLKVYYTRTSDTNPSLKERAAFAKEVGADLFVSLHMNASLATGAHGTEVYFSKKNNAPNSAGLTSERLARLLVDNLSNVMGTLNRGAKAEIYTVVHNNTVPAVLIELGFMSNKSNFELITDQQMQETAVYTIYDTLLQVFQSYPNKR